MTSLNQQRQQQVVIVGCGQERFGIGIQDVKEIIRLQPVTILTNCKWYIRGVINLRGRVVPVFGLAEKLGLPGSQDTAESRIVIVHDGDEIVGMVVNQVFEVTDLYGIQSCSDSEAAEKGLHLSGVAEHKNGLVGVLRMKAVLSK